MGVQRCTFSNIEGGINADSLPLPCFRASARRNRWRTQAMVDRAARVLLRLELANTALQAALQHLEAEEARLGAENSALLVATSRRAGGLLQCGWQQQP